MSKLGCVCGHTIRDQTDCLPYKAYIREDEDVQKPVEMLAEVLVQYWEAREQNREAEFIREFYARQGEPPEVAEWELSQLKGKPVQEVLYSLIHPFWNNYSRIIYECEQCGRLWVETEAWIKGEGLQCVAYMPETDTRHVLWSRRNHNPYGYLDE